MDWKDSSNPYKTIQSSLILAILTNNSQIWKNYLIFRMLFQMTGSIFQFNRYWIFVPSPLGPFWTWLISGWFSPVFHRRLCGVGEIRWEKWAKAKRTGSLCGGELKGSANFPGAAGKSGAVWSHENVMTGWQITFDQTFFFPQKRTPDRR